MTTTLGTKICKGYEPIAGYILEEAIGRGGFGEVWRASAPGGLKKAVKFVFGTQDSERSLRERRSLERIRGVQHPFLLTLERYEAIDNQLVIVTELADGSLEDVFKKCCAAGSCGIPRETLLGHLHDTADALDYLHDQYQLQHLDIKPANLLIIGGHVKVADFGLLKDLREAECSVVGGLTPVYAPPELFDGRPSRHSDQYSLAVMYQELLTGVRPFHGRSIAQLATQHVHSAPNLEPLPPADRPAVARALEKNPERRFDSCKAFVESLRSPKKGCRQPQVTGLDLDRGNAAGEFDHIGAVEDLPQLDDGRAPSSNRNGTNAHEYSLVVALGGTGAECLRILRRRAGAKHNERRLGLHSVLIDTDRLSLDSVRDTAVEGSIGPCELICTPLKAAKDYRAGGTERLKTISRRWIYNVPRSGTTEGMRPLGRLALVDHGPIVTQRLARAIKQLAADAGNVTPRVYVVGSLDGGTSSGMYLDVVHLLRHLLDSESLENAEILSMLSTAPMQADPGYPLAMYDAHAALIEMNHFLDAGNGYPGDPGAGWPSVPAARTPLHRVYIVAEPTLGSLSPRPVETICEYVWADSTGAGDLLSTARTHGDAQKSSFVGPTLHSVGVVPLSDGNRMQEKLLAPAVVRELMVRWLGLPSKAREAAVPFRDQLIRRVGLSQNSIVDTVRERLSSNKYRQWIAQVEGPLSDSQRQDWSCLSEVLDPALRTIQDDDTFKTIGSDLMTRIFGQLSVALTDWQADVTTTIESMKLIQATNAIVADDLRTNRSKSWISDDSDSTLDATSRWIAAYLVDQLNECLEYLVQRFERFATTLAIGVVQAKKLQGIDTNPWDLMPEKLRSQFSPTVARLHETTVNQFLIRTLIDHASTIDPSAMVNHLHDMAVQLVESKMDENRALAPQNHRPDEFADGTGTIAFATDSSRESEQLSQTAVPRHVHTLRRGAETLTVDEAIVAAKPALLEFGGQQRLILVVGTDREREQFEPQVRDAHDGSLTVAVIPGAEPKLIHEARRIQLASVLSRLKMLNGENAQVTGRLSSRTDITW